LLHPAAILSSDYLAFCKYELGTIIKAVRF
jgi:hypothetical protein